MPATTAYAPGKIILFGEHAVVYNRPAIACPVNKVRAKAVLIPQPKGEPGSVRVQAPDIGLDSWLEELAPDHPLRFVVDMLLEHLEIDHIPACILRVTSTIPVASGLGSSAAIPVAVMRALTGFLGISLPDEKINQLAFRVEQLSHGTPSGIDNTVITYSLPVYFIKEQPLTLLHISTAYTFVIGDSGVSSPTSRTVAAVRSGWQEEPERYEGIFDQIGSLTDRAKEFLERGERARLGELMDLNHELLVELGVSSPQLDNLVAAARRAGALGAKMSGGGGGGNMIALATAESAPRIAHSIMRAGAAGTITTTVE